VHDGHKRVVLYNIISRDAIRAKAGVGTGLSLSPSVGLYVCWSVHWVNCGKMADLIWMPLGVVSVVGRMMGVLDRMEIVEGEGQFWG